MGSTMAEPNESAQPLPTPGFISEVQQALEHLHNFPYLQSHPLVQRLHLDAEPSREPSGQRLRRLLVEAIESLSPGPSASFSAPHARLYNLLLLHYVEGMTVQEAAEELSVSLRQAYRDLRHGQESVASFLWASLPESGAKQQADSPPSSQPSSLQ